MKHAIYRFTNVHGRTNHGVILGFVNGGVNVLMDEFQPNDKTSLPARYAFISLESSPYVQVAIGKDVLPLEYPVRWQCQEIANIIKLMQSGAFDEWWQQNQGRIIRTYINGETA